MTHIHAGSALKRTDLRSDSQVQILSGSELQIRTGAPGRDG